MRKGLFDTPFDIRRGKVERPKTSETESLAKREYEWLARERFPFHNSVTRRRWGDHPQTTSVVADDTTYRFMWVYQGEGGLKNPKTLWPSFIAGPQAISRPETGVRACSGAFVFPSAAAEEEEVEEEAQMALNVANTPGERTAVHISMTERQTWEGEPSRVHIV